MARKRMIDPEFWSDEIVGKWSYAARLFYIGLWNFADDEGRFKANELLLKAQIFPYDERISIKKLQNEIGNKKIIWYEADGSKYGFIKNFLKYQKIDKPSPSKLPPPPEEKFHDYSGNDQGMVVPKLIEENIIEDKRRGFDECSEIRTDIYSQFFSEKQLDNPPFQQAWINWIDHNHAKEKKITPYTAKQQLDFLNTVPDPVGIINKAIVNNWNGLNYSNKNNSNGSNGTGKGDFDRDKYERLLNA